MVMKKLLVIVLMLAYGLSSSGMTISLHYCCGKLDGISLNGKHDDSCRMSSELKNTDCCFDKQISASITTDQQIDSKYIQVFKQTNVAPLYYEEISPVNDQVFSTKPKGRCAPFETSIPLFIKNCVFRI